MPYLKFFGSQNAAPASLSAFDWFQPLSAPSAAPRLRAAQQPSFSYDPNVILPPLTWFAPLGDPQRRASGLKTFTARNNSGNTYLPPVFGSTVFAVTTSFQGPTFTKATRYQGVAFLPNQTTGPELVTIDKWYAPLTDPKRVAPRRLPSPPELAFNSLPVVSFGWNHPFKDPLRLRVQPKRNFAEFNPFPLPNPAVGVGLEFYQPWTDPKRFPASLKTSQRPFTAFDPFPIPKPVLLEWFNPWTDPKRYKLRLKATLDTYNLPLNTPVVIVPPDCGHLYPSTTLLASLTEAFYTAGIVTQAISTSGKQRGAISKSGATRSSASKAGSMKPEIPC